MSDVDRNLTSDIMLSQRGKDVDRGRKDGDPLPSRKRRRGGGGGPLPGGEAKGVIFTVYT